jgi:hypothetical protein
MSRKMTMKSIRNIRKHALPSNADCRSARLARPTTTDAMFCDAKA